MASSIGALGIGLSVVFGVFLVLLLAELYYLLFWKRKSPRINSVAPNDPASVGAGAGAGAGSDVQQPSIVAKVFGDGLSAHIGMVGLDGECVLAPPRLLFTIREETREDLVDSEDAMKKPRLVMKGVSPTADHVVVQVFQPGVPDVRERERSLLHVSTSSSEASTSSSRSSGDEQVDPMEDIESGLKNRVGVRDEDEETICTTPFLTPPSSPGLSTPSSSPLRSSSSSLPNPIHFQAHRGSSSSSCYESPPSPPLVPMPVLPRNNSTGSSRSLLMNSPPFTPPSTSSRESKRSKRHLGLEDARVV